MKRYRRILLIAVVVLIIYTAGGCSQQTAASPLPSVWAENKLNDAIPSPSATPLPKPSSTASAKPEPTSVAAPEKISLEDEKLLYNYSYKDIEPFNLLFEDRISIDMDGDGQKEEVAVKPNQTKKVNGATYYTSMLISINGQQLEIKADSDWNMGKKGETLSPTIIDIYKKDGQRELLIQEQNYYEGSDAEPKDKFFLVTITDKKPKLFLKLDSYIQANGTGYILDSRYSKKLAGGYSIAFNIIKRYVPNKGFVEVSLDTYKTLSYSSFLPDLYEGVFSGWEQNIAKKPGEKTDNTLKKGTEIFFGMFDPSGWIEVHNSKGTTLGWLNLNEVDIDKYIGNAIEPSCH